MHASEYQGTRSISDACVLAKIHNPSIDIRKPYTEIGTDDSYSGRTYDENYVSEFIHKYELPANVTTAFLTPAFRNRNQTLTPKTNLVGRDPTLYKNLLQLLDDVHAGRVSSDEILAESIRQLSILRDDRELRMRSLLAELKQAKDSPPLSAEAIINLIQQHLNSPRSSRLPVLIV